MTTVQTEADSATDQARQGAGQIARQVGRQVERQVERSTARDWREHAIPAADDWIDRASGLAHQGADWVRDSSDGARRKLSDVSDSSLTYAREKPARTALAVVAAAVLMYGAWRLLNPRFRR